MKRIIFLAILLCLTSATVTGYLIFKTPTKNIPETHMTLWIVPGSSSSRIADQLVSAGVLQYKLPFKILLRLTKAHRQLKPGEYALAVPSSPWEVYQALINEKVIRYRVTLPEGLTTSESIDVICKTLTRSPADFEILLNDASLKKKLKVSTPRFEGFLFPDTYYFTRTTTPQTILETMVNHFYRQIDDTKLKKAKTFGWDLTHWMTLASIIEKESGVVSEQPIISSVFHNRLKKNMRLQSDPTVIYGIQNFNGNLTKKDLQTRTPYNTYTESGLPPGPICNPGKTALEAALAPAKTPYLYFVATGEGAHVFSEDYQQHLAYVQQYQLKK